MVDFSDMQTGLYHRVVLRKRSSISELPGHQRKSVVGTSLRNGFRESFVGGNPTPRIGPQNQDVFSESFLFDGTMIVSPA